MAVYAIGDLQGCFDALRGLLDQIAFDPAVDQLWFVGDLVNRGPKSLPCLRYVKDLGDRAVCVLGNHDLHLLALAAGNLKKAGKDNLDPILRAPDADDLLHWLSRRPLMHVDPGLDFVMVHAGLPPQWDIPAAEACAREVEQVLRGPDKRDYFMAMYGSRPALWSDGLSGMDRLRFITNCFTRLRYCAADGRLALSEKGPPGSQASGLMPWFTHPGRASRTQRILFGHWSTLGYHSEHNVWALDTGCLWGGTLTALRIDTTPPTPVFHNCPGQQDPARFA